MNTTHPHRIIDRLLGRLSGVKIKPPIPVMSEVVPRFHPRTPLLDFGNGQIWTLNDAYRGTQIFGATGSGKTSGSGAALAKSFLRQGYGILVLTAKPDDKELWLDYCADTGRDLTCFGPDSGHRFNFLQFERLCSGIGEEFERNVAALFVAIAEAGQEKAKTLEPYWVDSLLQLLCRAIALCTRAKGDLSLPMLRDIIMSGPQTPEEARSESWKSSSFCGLCLSEAKEKCTESNREDFEHTELYWLREFPSLGDRQRASIVSMFSVAADQFLTGSMRKLFCTGLNILPEETHAGRVILIDLPVEKYQEVGIRAQLIWKICWQRATARRDPTKDSGTPCVLWADEAHFFTSNGDARFQATARSKRACTVFLSQSIPTYTYRIGKDRTEALLSNLTTKIFGANGCHVTNTWAADTTARGIVRRASTNVSPSGTSFGTSEAVDYILPPAEFQRLRQGGEENNGIVDAVVFQAGRVWSSTGESYLRTSFKQPERKAI